MRTSLLTALALSAFAFNSILCRLALRGGEADAGSFTAVRLASGAITLVALNYLFGSGKGELKRGSWVSAFFLFAYAICFSLAYLGLTAGTGALILFGAVQLTMLASAIYRGERPRRLEWIGMAVAIAGLVYLVLPGLSSPPLHASMLMAGAGVAWGVYSLRGRGSTDPLGDTTGNFIRALPFAVGALALLYDHVNITRQGMIWAVLSGSLASGVGYAIWYSVLKHHTAARAAVLQLAVPVLAAFLAVLLLGEVVRVGLVISSAMVLGGIGLTIAARRR